MKYAFTALIAVVALILLGAPAAADWEEGDDYKMHHPQIPNPQGWDVNFTYPKIVADDWGCTETGPVADIHFWFSVMGQMTPVGEIPLPPRIDNVHVSIHKDLPVGDPENEFDYSIPGGLLEEYDFGADEIKLLGPFSGMQGWWDPNFQEGSTDDHNSYWQVNITNIRNPVIQREGEIYWLDLSMKASNVTGEPLDVGWKTTYEDLHFVDWPVYRDDDAAMAWQPVWDTAGGYPPVDMAFVITPEPGTVAMLVGAGLIGLLAYARRRRKS